MTEYYSAPMKEHEVRGTCSNRDSEENAYKIVVRTSEGRRQLEDSNVDGSYYTGYARNMV